MDEKIIPPGNFCYRVVKIKDGEILSQEIEKFGRELREFSYHGDYKEILCPYWLRTEYGTVRCNFLNREFLDDLDTKANEKIAAHFGASNVPDRIEYSSMLPDEIKICEIREDEDTQ